MPRNPLYRNKTTVARKLTQYDDVRDFWTTPPKAAPPSGVPHPTSPEDTAYLAELRRIFAPRHPRQQISSNYPALHLLSSPWDYSLSCDRCDTSPATSDEGLCLVCLLQYSIQPPTIPKPPPLSKEEFARRVAEREAEERVRRWDGAEPEYDPRQPAFLKVVHRDERGRESAKMVGRIGHANIAMFRALAADAQRIKAKQEPTDAWYDLAETGERERIFFHQHTHTQRHHKTNCPSPVDTVVEDFLRQVGIEWVVCYERWYDDRERQMPGVLRWTPLYRLKFAPEESYDERWRRYLPEERWDYLPEVSEYHRRNGSSVLHVGPEREAILDSSYVDEERAITLRANRPARARKES